MNLPSDLLYTKEHEWVQVEGNSATIGITDYAQEELGDIVYVELPDENQSLAADESFGSVESVKAVSEIYMPFSGTITEVNHELADSPETVNDDPYGDGWMIKVELADPEQIANLMSADAYREYLKEEQD